MENEIERERLLEQLQVLRAQTGDAQAYCQLFRKHNNNLLYYVRALLGERAESEDVLQEVWLTVLKKIGGLNDPGAFRAWLYRIARNHAVSRLRKKRKTIDLDAIDEFRLASDSETIEDDFVFQYDAASVHRGLGGLSTNHREVLALRFLEQLSYEEIANIVDCSVGTIRSRIHYAKRMLKEAIIQQKEDE